MPNVASTLKSDISRLAKREIRREVSIRSLLALSAIVLSGCSQEAHRAAMQVKGEACLPKGQPIQAAKMCLASKGLSDTGKIVRTGKPPQDVLFYQTCSGLLCSGLVIKLDADTVQSWESWSQWDGI